MNDAAAEVGQSEVDNMTAKSNAEIFFDSMVYTSQCVSFCEQSVRDWTVEVSFEGRGLEWYVSELFGEVEGARFQMVRCRGSGPSF